MMMLSIYMYSPTPFIEVEALNNLRIYVTPLIAFCRESVLTWFIKIFIVEINC
ncbi:hypothetical protein HanPSC8_Chr02g0068771 [Helianthus annuus]|nr:hypothetical protein HanPSC8_Chr02g0068771 [Helianthus annuus]